MEYVYPKVCSEKRFSPQGFKGICACTGLVHSAYTPAISVFKLLTPPFLAHARTHTSKHLLAVLQGSKTWVRIPPAERWGNALLYLCSPNGQAPTDF